MKNYWIVVCLLFGITACSDPSPLRRALQLAGDNRTQLEEVLDHYSLDDSDSLKYRAACFLIENMVYHFSVTGPGVEDYYRRVDSVFAIPALSYPTLHAALQTIQPHDARVGLSYDIEQVTSDFLIAQIEDAFALRSYPWCAELSFEDFCEYVLPYRIAHEPLEAWRPVYARYLGAAASQLAQNGACDSAVCAYLSRYVMHPPAGMDLAYRARYDFSPSWYIRVMTRWSVGNCPELVRLGTYAMRSVGLPVAWDYTPKWANRATGHDWNSLPVRGGLIPFSVKDNRPFGEHLKSRRHDRFAKVYRKMYSLQPQSLAMQKDVQEDVPAGFSDPYQKDVTELYTDCTDICVELTIDPPRKTRLAYVMTFDNNGWFPVHWGRIKDGKTCFTKMAKGNLYMVMYYQDGCFHPALLPFFLDQGGRAVTLEPCQDSLVSVALTRKYPNYNVDFVLDRMKGGVFQGANRADFSDGVNLHVIDSLDDLVPHTVRLDHAGSFRFFRYLSAPQGFVNMAEIELFDASGEMLQGRVIGAGQSTYKKDRSTVFDKNPLTYFNAVDSSGAWVGLAFDRPETLHKLRFVPRTDGNYIEAGDLYELFYYDRDGWVSLGAKPGLKSGDTLRYDRVPARALLLLKDHTQGKEERIFVYENGRQIWL